MNSQKLLITGGTGLVGSHLRKYIDVASPTHSELDITRIDQTTSYFDKRKPTVVIHAAAYTRNERDKCWEVNVLGTRNIDAAARKVGAFHIFISTGSVFRGNGPFAEDDQPNAPKSSWYAWTKREAEKCVNGAIIRISHPLYIQRLLTRKMFYDNVQFPLTSISELARAIKVLVKKPRPGIYHVASPDFVSPHELMSILKKVRKTHTTKQFPAISVVKTQKILGLRFKSWKEVCREELPVLLGDKGE